MGWEEKCFESRFKVYIKSGGTEAQRCMWQWREFHAALGIKSEPYRSWSNADRWSDLGIPFDISSTEWHFVHTDERTDSVIKEHCMGTEALLLVLFDMLQTKKTVYTARL